MAIVVLGEDDGQWPKGAPKPARRAPSELRGMAPPDVDLPERESPENPYPRDAPEQCADDQIWDGTEETVEQDGRLGRKYRVIEVRTAPVVMRAQVQPEPEMLRNVIEERRCKVAGDECNDESGNEEHSCGDLAM